MAWGHCPHLAGSVEPLTPRQSRSCTGSRSLRRHRRSRRGRCRQHRLAVRASRRPGSRTHSCCRGTRDRGKRKCQDGSWKAPK
jgi:hypothetical protein